MTENDFNGLFGDDFSELNAAMQAAEAEHAEQAAAKAAAKPKKDGLWYVRDEDNPAHGHTISVYAVNMGGKTVAWVRVDNDLEVSTAPLGKLPAGITGHAIVVYSADGGRDIVTNGIALKTPHKDGNHLDGQSVRAFVLPRLARFLGELYGV